MPTKKKAAPAGYDFGAFKRTPGALSGLFADTRLQDDVADIQRERAALRNGMDTRRRRPDTIRASAPSKGVLTGAVSNGVQRISRALGASERTAAQRASAFEAANLEYNPLSQADELGTQLRRYASGSEHFDKGALAHGAIGTALTLGGEAIAPVIGALSRTGAGKAVGSFLSKRAGAIPDDGIIDAVATSRSVSPRRATPDVRTKDGAIVTPPAAQPAVLPSPGKARPLTDEVVDLQHFSHNGALSRTDPEAFGTNPNRGFTSKSELASGGVNPRTYFGVRTGEVGGYRRESGAGQFAYEGQVPKSSLLEVGSPQHASVQEAAREIMASGDKRFGPYGDNGKTLMDTLANRSGYAGVLYPHNKSELGSIAQVFKPVDVKPLERPLPNNGAAPAPIRGLPQRIKVGDDLEWFGPDGATRQIAEDYMKVKGLPYRPPADYANVDPQRAAAIAAEFDRMRHAPTDPKVRGSYDQMVRETLDQYEAAKARGMQFDFYPEDGADPYGNPWNALKDLRQNKSLKVYPTDAGYGSGGITDDMVQDNPLLAAVPGETWGGKPVRVNDVFRAVHDVFGHNKEGVGFRAAGEENAWRSHAAMFSPEARGAMTTETRGQNSWLNYGPHAETNQTAAVEDTVFADQKIGLMPEWTSTDGAVTTAPFDPKVALPPKTKSGSTISWNKGPDGYKPYITAQSPGGGWGTIVAPADDVDPLPEWLGALSQPKPQPRVRPTGPAAPLNDQTDRIVGALENSPRMRAARGEAVEAPPAPAVTADGRGLWPRISEAPSVTGEGVLAKAAAPKKEPFKAWRDENDAGPGDLFDYSQLSQVPDVPQVPMDRYQPPRGPSARITDALANPKVAEGINGYVERGAALGGKDWYNTDPLREKYLEALGPDEGQAAYARFMDAVAATSPRSTVPDNIRTASYYNFQRENGLPVTDKPAPGYGSVAQNLHASNMGKLVDGDGWDIMANPKPASFSTNLQGNQENVTIDTHNFRLPGILSEDPRFLETSIQEQYKGGRKAATDNLLASYPGLSGASVDEAVKGMPDTGLGKVSYRPQKWVESGEVPMADAVNDPALWTPKPKDNEYGVYEDWQREQAAKLGMSPAQYQASMWVGAGDATGLASPPEPFLRTLEARVKYTAAQLGFDPKVVLDALIRGKSPLLSVAGAGVLASTQLNNER